MQKNNSHECQPFSLQKHVGWEKVGGGGRNFCSVGPPTQTRTPVEFPDGMELLQQSMDAMLRQILLRILMEMPADPVKYMMDLIKDYHRESEGHASP